MVNTLKKRIVIRTDESIRKPEVETIALLNSSVSKEIQIDYTFFDHALGEAEIYVQIPFGLTSIIEDGNFEIVEKTGWKLKFRKTPSSVSIMQNIHKILYDTVEERIQFYKDVGERIFRSKLDDSPAEASITALGGFADVGRSAILLSTHESKILLDCGLNLFAKELPTCSASSWRRTSCKGLKSSHEDTKPRSKDRFFLLCSCRRSHCRRAADDNWQVMAGPNMGLLRVFEPSWRRRIGGFGLTPRLG